MNAFPLRVVKGMSERIKTSRLLCSSSPAMQCQPGAVAAITAALSQAGSRGSDPRMGLLIHPCRGARS